MVMTNEEIVRDYCQARNKNKQIKILADLNVVTPGEIRAILAAASVEGIKAPQRIRRKKVVPPGEALEIPAEDGPMIYQQIENILASLPENMGEKARRAAGKLAAELFAEYLMLRLGLQEVDGNIDLKGCKL